jgi:hypothetical protein
VVFDGDGDGDAPDELASAKHRRVSDLLCRRRRFVRVVVAVAVPSTFVNVRVNCLGSGTPA